VFHDSFTHSRGALTKVFAETAHAAAECSTCMKRPAMFHVLTKTPATVTDAHAGFFVRVPNAAMPVPSPITAYATAMSTANAGIVWEGVRGVCAKLRQPRCWNSR
jgi:hypothetical protein